MCYILSEHFTGIFLFLCMVHHDPSHSGITIHATSLKSSEEIKNIFSFPDVTESVLKDSPHPGNFAEGGLITTNLTQSPSRPSIKDFAKNSHSPKNVSYDKNPVKNQNISFTTMSGYGNHNFFEPSTVKTSMPTKLTETASNLFSGGPEVIHVNGTSAIKPRKGVHYNKIVARKGVDNENESSHDFLEHEACFQLTENECYNVTGIHGLVCNSCKEGNMLGKIVKQQVMINCKNCKPINVLSSEKEVCCNSVVHDIYSASTSQNISNNYLKYETVANTQKKEQNMLVTQVSEKAESSSSFPIKMAVESKHAILNSKNNSKLKPSMTKVPYDVEVVTELLGKTQQKIFVPIVSIFLLPLIGILLFFLWRRTKEHWEKRYYKRMDFLIDGIYND